MISVTVEELGGNGSATGTINNDDSATVSIGNASVTEGGNLVFNVSLTNAVDVDTVITYSTADGSATTVDNDYTAQASQTLTILAGQTSGTISVATTADNQVELDETLDLILSTLAAGGRDVSFNGGGATLTGTGTIANDDFLGGLVFDDLDNDGLFEPADGDAGIENVLMQLVNETSGSVVDVDLTDASGRYEFDVTLAAGIYKIVEVVDEMADLGLLDGKETAGG